MFLLSGVIQGFNIIDAAFPLSQVIRTEQHTSPLTFILKPRVELPAAAATAVAPATTAAEGEKAKSQLPSGFLRRAVKHEDKVRSIF